MVKCILLAMVLLLVMPAFAVEPTPADIATGRTLCAEGEKLLHAGKYTDALATSRKVLTLLPASSRGKALYAAAVKELSAPTPEVQQIVMAAANLVSADATTRQELLGLYRHLSTTASKAQVGASARINQLASMESKLEEIEETTITKRTTEKSGNTEIIRERVYRNDQRRAAARQTAVVQYAAREATDFIQRANANISAVEAQCAAREADINAIRAEMTYLCELAARRMLDVEGYGLAHVLLEQAVSMGAPLNEARADVYKVLSGQDVQASVIPAVIQALDRQIASWKAGGSYRICDFADRIELLEYFLDSHSTDSCVDLSNCQVIFRSGPIRRLEGNSDGRIRHIRGGDIGKCIAANLSEARCAGKWQALQLTDQAARCSLPQDGLCVFYQEGPVLYAERLGSAIDAQASVNK